ncbi:MAG TPA: cytochrome c [Longimicrobiales bacterium]|nr:cytochrome c [Longimicrobiales bacterium]
MILPAALALGAGACTPLDNALASIPAFAFMRSAPSFDPYEATRPAPPGSVPYLTPSGPPEPPLPATAQALEAFGATVTNPIPPTPESIERGKALYERYCFVCHGATGQGNGPVVQGPGDEPGRRLPPVVPNLLLPASMARTDAYMYAVIRVGRGLMPRYGDKVTPTERWHIVNYIRQLQAQGAQGAGAQAQAGAAAGTGEGER